MSTRNTLPSTLYSKIVRVSVKTDKHLKATNGETRSSLTLQLTVHKVSIQTVFSAVVQYYFQSVLLTSSHWQLLALKILPLFSCQEELRHILGLTKRIFPLHTPFQNFVKIRDPIKHFLIRGLYAVKSYWLFAETPIWSTTYSQPFITVYWIYTLLPFTSERCLFYPLPKDAPCRGSMVKQK